MQYVVQVAYRLHPHTMCCSRLLNTAVQIKTLKNYSKVKWFMNHYEQTLMSVIIPVIESETWSPIRSVKYCLNGTGKVRETVAHQKEPTTTTRTNGINRDIYHSILIDKITHQWQQNCYK